MIQAVPTSATAPATTGATTARPGQDQSKLKSAAQAFEAVFLRQMIGSMREASLGDGILDNDASNTFQQMADSKTADAMASKGVLHIADLLMKQLGPLAAKQVGSDTGTGTGTTATLDHAQSSAAQDGMLRGVQRRSAAQDEAEAQQETEE